jgi:hypothetical protein
MKLEHIAAILTALCAIATVWQTLSIVENRKLKRKLRQAIKDCIAFYQLEELYCQEIAGNWTLRDNPTPLAIKRIFRARLRGKNNLSPSADATPQRLVEELRKVD